MLPASGLVIYTNLQQRRAEARKAQEDALQPARLVAKNQAQIGAERCQLLITGRVYFQNVTKTGDFALSDYQVPGAMGGKL